MEKSVRCSTRGALRRELASVKVFGSTEQSTLHKSAGPLVPRSVKHLGLELSNKGALWQTLRPLARSVKFGKGEDSERRWGGPGLRGGVADSGG